jgi:hypothetical protein
MDHGMHRTRLDPKSCDCGKSLTKLLTIADYAGGLESGEMVLKSSPPNQEWASVGQRESGTIAKNLWALACSKD